MTDSPRDPNVPAWLLAQADQLAAMTREQGPGTNALMDDVFAEAEREDLAVLDEIEGPGDLAW